MADFTVYSIKKLKGVEPESNAEVIEVPEDEEVVKERNFQKRLAEELEKKLQENLEANMLELNTKIQAEKKESFGLGYKEGHDVGLEEGHSEIEHLRQSLWKTIREVEEFKNQILKESEATIVSLAFKFAKTIVGKEIESDSEIIRNQVKNALAYIIDESKLVIRVNPEDVSQFDRKEKFLPEEYLNVVEIVPDESIDQGGCIIETNAGIIDATIDAKIEQLEKSIQSDLETDIEPDTGENQ